mgnify:CR=1 FL=1
MIAVEDAMKIVHANLGNWGIEEISLDQSLGRILREEIVADRDFPPFNRVTMDGIGLNFDEFEKFSTFPIFHRVNSKDKFEIETHHKLLIDTFSNENKSLGIISIGKFKNNYLEFYKSSLKEFSKEKSWIISDNLLDTKDYPSILIIANLGVVTKSDLGLFIDQLKLQEKKVLGSILINSKAN